MWPVCQDAFGNMHHSVYIVHPSPRDRGERSGKIVGVMTRDRRVDSVALIGIATRDPGDGVWGDTDRDRRLAPNSRSEARDVGQQQEMSGWMG